MMKIEGWVCRKNIILPLSFCQHLSCRFRSRLLSGFAGPRFIRCCLLLFLFALAFSTSSPAQEPRTVDPRKFGIELAPGPLVQSKGESVSTTDDASQPAIGRIHVRVGDGAIILLPDGQLVPRRAGQFSPSARPFEPLTKDALVKKLAAEFPSFKTRASNTGPYVYAYSTSEPFASATSRILESMLSDTKGLRAFAENQRIDAHSPEIPLVVVMFKTEQDFQNYRRLPDGVVAYYHTLSNRVFMYEESRLGQVRPDLALRQSISTIAHEGAHQILHNIGVQQRLSMWPMWLAEGLAEYLAPTSTGKNLTWKGTGQVNDMRMFELEQYLKSRAADEPDGQMIEQTVMAPRLTSTGYATAWSLTHYLAKAKRVEFAAYLREVSKLGPLEGVPPIAQSPAAAGNQPRGLVRENMDLFTKQFGDDLKEHERRLVLHLKNLPYKDPFADFPHCVALLSLPGQRPPKQVGTFHSPSLAQKWIRETIDTLPDQDRSRADSQIRVFPNRAQAEAYARDWLRQ